MPQIRRSGPSIARAASTITNASKSTADHRQIAADKSAVDAVDASIWAALFDGQFRLAVRCDTCGRWLTDGRSKANHRGPRCAAKAAIR